MHGFISIVSLKKEIIKNPPISWKKTFSFQPKHLSRNIIEQYFFIESFTSESFINEKICINHKEFTLVIDGIILNINKLYDKYNVDDIIDLIIKISDGNNDFFREFEGSFAGIFHNKKLNKWILFNNQTGTKKLFYFFNEDYLIASTDLYVLTQCLQFYKISYSLNIESSYLLLSTGFISENQTFISEIKQVRPGEFILFTNNAAYYDYYYHLNNIKHTNDSKRDIIANLDHLFKEAIKLEYDKDIQYGYPHLVTMSGGLDSRMTSLVAHELGYKNQVYFNFSKKGYADDLIVKEIAKNYQISIKKIHLDSGCLSNIDDVVSVNDGLILYIGCSHVFFAEKKLNETFGIIHTGMIGDAVLGSFLTSKIEQNPKITDGIYTSNFLFNKAKRTLEKTLSNYQNEELYKFYTRAFMGANSGYLYYDLIGETSSPFLNTDFLSYAYSIPIEYKYKRAIYIDWIKDLHPNIAKYTWEGIGGKPTNNSLLLFYYRYKKAIIKRLPINTMWKYGMTLEQLWYDNDNSIKDLLDSYFNRHIDLIKDNELRNDATKLYSIGNITDKANVLTLLSVIKQLFNE